MTDSKNDYCHSSASSDPAIPNADRRRVLAMIATTGAAVAVPHWAGAASAGESAHLLRDVIEQQKQISIKRLQDWIALPSIAAEGLNSSKGATKMAELLRDAGFQTVEIINTKGKPGVFAILDAGARRTTGMYFMYDVKQFDAGEWTSPPLAAEIVTKPDLGTVMIGRGAINQKGPQATFLAALHALRAAGRKSPVNIVLVAEGEEEIGSPNIAEIIHRPAVLAAFKNCREVWTPAARQEANGDVRHVLGAKGLMEVELVCSAKAWGRGAAHDIHSMYRPQLDSPVFRLIAALSTLVSEDGNDPAIDGWFEHVRPLTPRQRQMVADHVASASEADTLRQLGAQKWVRDLSFLESTERLISQPTVNIEGIFGGYTGPGGKTIIPSQATAKLDFRLVPDQTAQEAERKLREHLERRGFFDISINITGSYGPNQTDEDAPVNRAARNVYRRAGVPVATMPRSPGSNPGYIFTDAPISLPRGHFGFGHGGRLHAPDEYYVIDPVNTKILSFTQAVEGYVNFLYELSVV